MYTAEELPAFEEASQSAKDNIRGHVKDFYEDWLPEHSYTETDDGLILYHYTDASGLRGIVESGDIRCFDVAFMKDKRELQYGQNLILEEIEKLKTNYCDELRIKILDVLRGHVKAFHSTKHSRLYHVFIACFCPDEKSQHNWEKFGREGHGYALGFYFTDATRVCIHSEAAASSQFDQKKATLRKVIYHPRRQRKLIRSYLKEACVVYDRTFTNCNEIERKPPSPSTEALFGPLVEFIVSFKHPKYFQEQEWRLIRAFRRNFRKRGKRKHTKMSKYLQHRVVDCLVTSYVPTALMKKEAQRGDWTFPLKNIWCGPKLDDRSIMAADLFRKRTSPRDSALEDDVLVDKAEPRKV